MGVSYNNLSCFERANIELLLIHSSVWVSHDDADIERLTTPTFINQNSTAMNFIIRGTTIIIEKDVIMNKGFSSNKYRSTHGGIMTKTENNHLIIRAFATVWKYREQYERLDSVDTITAKEKVSPMTIYRYMNLGVHDAR